MHKKNNKKWPSMYSDISLLLVIVGLLTSIFLVAGVVYLQKISPDPTEKNMTQP